jgi:hypothetical protein
MADGKHPRGAVIWETGAYIGAISMMDTFSANWLSKGT